MTTFTPTSLSDSCFKSMALPSPMDNNDLIQQVYQPIPPSLMTPLDDWCHSDMFESLVEPSVDTTSLVQDAFLTSPCSSKDYLWMPSSPPQDLFSALSTTTTVSNKMNAPLDDLIDTLVVPNTSLDLLSSPDQSSSSVDKTSNSSSPSVGYSPSSTTSPPLEMIMTLDSPLTTDIKKNKKKNKKDGSTGKVLPPPAAQAVASHITSASTPTFALKQTPKKRSSNNTSDLSGQQEQPISSELALKRQKNTDAARRSRLRKLQKMETMASRVSELEAVHQQLLIRLSALESNNSHLLQKEVGYLTRIQQLEADLTLAQEQLKHS
ncbi:uncharacterized protein BX664DRAFT_310605 [Halteromyces radiatus]|uniref:uncharacterized protein n=1 Tax=Halteromyces radiatus TaxID=101107 RepID=UPI00222107A0|nr:uncharacterized protein BX664DRAFT_310605 [Halteromyces radiatus]KAI8099661.1 hypothetical protein BX664DRAFT_310605 [Halteromyces radiatus]